jgi:DNA-binding FadR family transcriptional regulator
MTGTTLRREASRAPGTPVPVGREVHVAVERGDGLGFAALDLDFHMRVVAAGGNRVVVETIARLGPRYARLTHLAVAGDLDAARGFRAEHERLAALAAAGDAAAYGTAVRAHIAAAYFPGDAR